jgi:hypothetical protein
LKAKRNILLLGLWKEGRQVRRNPKPNSYPLAGKAERTFCHWSLAGGKRNAWKPDTLKSDRDILALVSGRRREVLLCMAILNLKPLNP